MTTTKKENCLIWDCFAICSLIFISLCFNNNVWLDEAFTASLVHTDLGGVLERSMADTLPPLYNILLWASTSIFGYFVPVMKLTSVLPMVLTLLLGATVLKKRFGYITSLLFMVLITGMPLMFYFGIEVRMYSLGFFFATAAGIYAYEVICDYNIRNCLIFSVMSVLAGYSHHFAFVAVGFVYGFLLLYYFFMDRNNIKRWFIALAVTIGLYIPCGIVTLKQLKSVSGYFSMSDIDLHLFIQYAIYPFTCNFTPVSILLMALSVAVILFGIIMLIRREGDKVKTLYCICCFIIFYGVLIFGTCISKVMTANIFVDRYLFFSTGLMWLGISVLIPSINNKWIKIAAPIVIAAAFITDYTVQFSLEYSNSASEEIKFISENFSDNDILCTVEDGEELQFCIPFYSMIAGKNKTEYYGDLKKALDYSASNENATLWIVAKEGFTMSDETIKTLSEYNCTVEDMASFDFDRYRCQIYRVK